VNHSSNMLGLAGELRVMSELLLRGHNPAKSYLEDGYDVLLDNGKRVEIKASQLISRGKHSYYQFSLMGGHSKHKQNLEDCDFLILWCIEDDQFYIIPTKGMTAKCIAISNVLGRGKYAEYLDRWDLLRRVE